MGVTEKAKEKIDETTRDIKETIENLKNEIAELTGRIKEKLKGKGEELRESAEELSKELKNLSERVKEIVPKGKGKKRLPVHIEKPQGMAVTETWQSPLLELKRATDQLFDEFEKSMMLPDIYNWPSPLSFAGEVANIRPRADISETEDNVLITVDLPGVDKEDIQISLSDNSITIKGEKKQEKEEEDRDYYKIERSYGFFQRSFYLPCEVETDKVDATFKDGVLNIVLPKTAAAKEKTKTIPIKVK